MNMLRRMSLIALVLAFGLIAAACGGDDDTTDATQGDAQPLETTTEAPAETTEAPAEETTTTAAPEFDLVAAVQEYESTIPDGWMNVGDVTSFKDALAASGGLVIDVRQPNEYEEGHIPGAINIPLRELAANVDKIPTDKAVYVYCQSGFRAGVAVSAIRLMGYDNALAYKDSYLGWTEAGEEVSTDPVEAEVFGDPGFAPELVAAVDDYLSTLPDGWGIIRSVEDVQGALDAGSVILDVRSDGEFEEGHIEGAILTPLRTISTAENTAKIPTDTQFIIHCKSGWRATIAMPVIGVLGFDNWKVFPGGWNAWVDAGAPVVTG
ncbi:MAG: rhodanese-like domain-containing protein [Acidimicrobiia bacterium]|nr:rhodanese-like domain-containing protein [Acidimicrobiia bacterium]